MSENTPFEASVGQIREALRRAMEDGCTKDSVEGTTLGWYLIDVMNDEKQLEKKYGTEDFQEAFYEEVFEGGLDWAAQLAIARYADLSRQLKTQGKKLKDEYIIRSV